MNFRNILSATWNFLSTRFFNCVSEKLMIKRFNDILNNVDLNNFTYENLEILHDISELKEDYLVLQNRLEIFDNITEILNSSDYNRQFMLNKSDLEMLKIRVEEVERRRNFLKSFILNVFRNYGSSLYSLDIFEKKNVKLNNLKENLKNVNKSISDCNLNISKLKKEIEELKVKQDLSFELAEKYVLIALDENEFFNKDNKLKDLNKKIEEVSNDVIKRMFNTEKLDMIKENIKLDYNSLFKFNKMIQKIDYTEMNIEKAKDILSNIQEDQKVDTSLSESNIQKIENNDNNHNGENIDHYGENIVEGIENNSEVEKENEDINDKEAEVADDNNNILDGNNLSANYKTANSEINKETIINYGDKMESPDSKKNKENILLDSNLQLDPMLRKKIEEKYINKPKANVEKIKEYFENNITKNEIENDEIKKEFKVYLDNLEKDLEVVDYNLKVEKLESGKLKDDIEKENNDEILYNRALISVFLGCLLYNVASYTLPLMI